MTEKYYCCCANITINVNNVKETIDGVELVHKNMECEITDDFFTEKLMEVDLSISGIEIAQHVLTKNRNYQNWEVKSCINCGKDCYCVQHIKGVTQLLISSSLKRGADFLNELRGLSSYSTILNFDVQEFHRARKPSYTFTSEEVDQITRTLNKAVDQGLRKEEEAMNERIRLFADFQRNQFKELQMTVNHHKENIIRKISKYETRHIESLFDSFDETHFGDNSFEQQDLLADLPAIKEKEKNKHPITNPLKEPYSKQTHFPKNQNSSEFNVFSLEDFQNDENCEAFYESYDDSDDTASLESGGYHQTTLRRNFVTDDRVYATSVPVSIPLFDNTRHVYDPRDEPEYPQNNQIADSIKALAKSMQDSTGIFGEVPRPRLNTSK